MTHNETITRWWLGKEKDVGKEIREHSSILDLPHIYDRPSHLWKATRRLDSESCRTTTNRSKASCTGPEAQWEIREMTCNKIEGDENISKDFVINYFN